MKTIAFVVPYFGTLPKGFRLWLLSCRQNPTVDWLLFTDDRTEYDYPNNVKVNYCSFQELKDRIQQCFDFEIELSHPYKLCDFKAAYGEIFAEDLKGYDYWGMCDVDLVWGDIRKFLTDDLLSSYDRIGNQGHCSVFRNTEEVSKRYRTILPGLKKNYKTSFTSDKPFCFDESGLDGIYQALGIDYYHEVNFIHLLKYNAGFFLGLMPKEDDIKNHRQIVVWEKGCVTRYYLHESKVCQEEYMYCHFWCRPMTFRIRSYYADTRVLIYSDVCTDRNFTVDEKLLNHYGRPHPAVFLTKSLWFNRHKITVKKIASNLKGMGNQLLRRR